MYGATLVNNLALILFEKGELDEAEELYREALATKRRAHGPRHPGVAETLHNLASLVWRSGRHDEAERWFHRWRIFFLSCAELFGYRDGNEWWVTHLRFRKPARDAG